MGKAIRGLVLYLVPYVIMELITMAIAVSKGHGSHLITAAGKMFLEHLLMYLLLYFGAVLALQLREIFWQVFCHYAVFTFTDRYWAFFYGCWK